MMNKTIEKVNLENPEHCDALISLLNLYMQDKMGAGKSMSSDLALKIIRGLKKHSAYLGFLVQTNNRYIGLVNCNLNFSSWRAKFLINIHDFIVHPDYRNQGIGMFLLDEIEKYAINKGYCKLNLEVRKDNCIAQGLYEKAGFKSGDPSMLFWEKDLFNNK